MRGNIGRSSGRRARLVGVVGVALAATVVPVVPATAADFTDPTDDVWRQTLDPDGEPVYAAGKSYPTADLTSISAAAPVDTGHGSSTITLTATLQADPSEEEFGLLVFGLDGRGGDDVNTDTSHIAAVGFGALAELSSLGRSEDAAFNARQIGCPSYSHTWTSPTRVDVTFDSECIGAPARLSVGAQTLVLADQMVFADFAPEVTGRFSDSEDGPPQPPAFVLDLPGAGRRIAPTGRDVSATCAGAPAAGFRDAEGNLHRDSIDCIAAEGIAKGKGDGTYGTGESLRRDQIASFLVSTMQAAGLPLPSEPADAFTDDEGNVHEGNIDILAELRIVDVPEDGRYRPGGLVTRADMAQMVYRTVSLVVGFPADHAPPDYFSDDDRLVIDVERAIGGIAELGVVTGKGAGRYGPSETLRRDQMATFLARLLDASS